MSILPVTATHAGLADAPSARARRVAAILLPFALLLVWTAAVRLPFYFQTDKDEFFFSVIASRWLQGGLPYVATFDIKPPGLFFLYALVQEAFGASQAVIKGMEIVAVALGGSALYALVKRNGSDRAALWVAVLFPVYTVTLGGAIAVNMLFQLPFLIAAFWAALAAVREGESSGRRMTAAFLAGLAIGGAGMLKQTAMFEAAGIFAVLWLYGGGQQAWRLAVLFVLGAALPVAAFSLYFAAEGHFAEMFDAVVRLARMRTDADVLDGYGPDAAYYFTILGTIDNVFSPSAPLLFLWAGGIFAVLRRQKLRKAFPSRLMAVSGIWLVASLAGVFVSRGLCTYYLLAIVPPLLIVAGAFYCHGLEVPAAQQARAFVLTVVAAIASVAFIDRHDLFTPTAFLAGDYRATNEVSARLLELGLKPEDRLLVLNRGLSVYVETGAMPPTPYFHPTHLLGVFHTPVADPLGVTLAANARFVVVANAGIRHITELAARYDQALAYLNAHYRVAARVEGEKDSFTIYEFAG